MKQFFTHGIYCTLIDTGVVAGHSAFDTGDPGEGHLVSVNSGETD